MLNMFRMLIHPYLKSLRLICWVISWVVLPYKDRGVCISVLFSGGCLVVMCVVVLERVLLQILAAAVSYGYWVFFVCSMFFYNVSLIYSDVYMSLHIPVSMCVGVTLWFGWGGVVSVCRLRHYWPVHVTNMYLLYAVVHILEMTWHYRNMQLYMNFNK